MGEESKIGFEEGDKCRREHCEGVIELKPAENCSCHINPPCSACTEPAEFCPSCGWKATDDEFDMNGFLCRTYPHTQKWDYRPRPLDPSKIDYRVKWHTTFSQILEGVYPEGTTKEEVLEKVKGTFGGRFSSFGGGKFKYIAYTD